MDAEEPPDPYDAEPPDANMVEFLERLDEAERRVGIQDGIRELSADGNAADRSDEDKIP